MVRRIWYAAGAVLFGLLALLWQTRMNFVLRSERAKLEESNRRLRGELADLKRRLASAPAHSLPEPPERIVEHGGLAEQKSLQAQLTKQAQTVEQLQGNLGQANAVISKLEARVVELETQVEKLSADNKRVSSSEADLNESLASANRLIDALQKELKSKSDRLVQVEVAGQKLREQSRADSEKITQLTQLSAELQELQRRGETYLNSILRRYREITDQYRALSTTLQNRRVEPGDIGSADLSRIQSSISMAEEDLRQLSVINAQALRLQRKIAGK